MDGSRATLFQLFFEVLDELADAVDGFFEVDHGAAIAGADVAFAAGAEGVTGDERDALLFEQLYGEFARSQPGFAD